MDGLAGPVSRRPTIDDVAAAAGVSRAAVSKAMRGAYGVSEDMHRRVRAAVSDLGYRPRVAAQAMRGSTSTVGVMIPAHRTAFFDDVLAGVSQEFSTTPYQLIQAPADLAHVDGEKALEALYDRQVDGILAIGPMVVTDRLEDLARRIPLVQLGLHVWSTHFDTVLGDDATGARLVMDHLLARGHRRISHLTHVEPSREGRGATPHEARLAVYESAMRSAGLLDHVDVIAGHVHELPSQVAVRAALLERPHPTAIFAGNDDAALGALRAMADLGLSTTDVAVCGYDDSLPASHPLVSLTSVDQQGVEMGRRAAKLLRERIDGRRTERHEVIRPRLVVRASTQRRPHPA